MNRLTHLAQRIFNCPVAIEPAKAAVIVAALAQRLGIAHLVNVSGEPVAMMATPFDASGKPEMPEDEGYDVIAGVAVIPVLGTLTAKLGCLQPVSGMTGYDGIRANFLTALNDDLVRAIVLDIDSPGGEVAGLFDLADVIYAARGVKPVRAILTETAYSAAYALASAADRISVPRTGGTGSIGVMCMHVDYSRAIGEAGATVTLIKFGERKTEANSYEPLARDARAALQRDIDTLGGMFAELVARNRSLPVSAVLATEAGCFLGAEGVALGLADVVEAPDEAFADLLDDLRTF